ncbi:MAG: ABC transporter permease [Deltaproteobacteria bacterium]|nr:ABC transporter permease [Deltaproteobacteria bacterium]
MSSGYFPPNLLPGPGRVLAVFLDVALGRTGEAGIYSGTLATHTLASLWRVYAGFLVGIGLGIFLGLLMGLFLWAERALNLSIQVLRNIPITAWRPLAIIFFGLADRPAIFLIALGAFFPSVMNTIHGVKGTDRIVVKAGLMMGMNQEQLLRLIVLPSALPAIFTGVRLSMGISWMLVILGYLLLDANYAFRTDVVIAMMLNIGIAGYLSDRLLLLLRHSLLGWTRGVSIGG